MIKYIFSTFSKQFCINELCDSCITDNTMHGIINTYNNTVMVFDHVNNKLLEIYTFEQLKQLTLEGLKEEIGYDIRGVGNAIFFNFPLVMGKYENYTTSGDFNNTYYTFDDEIKIELYNNITSIRDGVKQFLRKYAGRMYFKQFEFVTLDYHQKGLVEYNKNLTVSLVSDAPNFDPNIITLKSAKLNIIKEIEPIEGALKTWTVNCRYDDTIFFQNSREKMPEFYMVSTFDIIIVEKYYIK